MQTSKAVETLIAQTKRAGLKPGGGKGKNLRRGAERVGVQQADDESITVYHEYYRPEGYGDDDDSFNGYELPHVPGYARVRLEWPATDAEQIPPRTAQAIRTCVGA